MENGNGCRLQHEAIRVYRTKSHKEHWMLKWIWNYRVKFSKKMSTCVLGVLYRILLAMCWILSTVDGQACHLYDETNTLLTSSNTLLTLECSFICGTSSACTRFRICREFHQENCTVYRTVSKINCGDSATSTVCILFSKVIKKFDYWILSV